MTMTEIIPHKSLIPTDHEINVFQTMAKQAVGSKLYRGIGDEFAVMTIMLAARELDIPPMAALNGGINIINGKTEISARMMAALIFRRGHVISIEESTDTKCVLKGYRNDISRASSVETFTIEEAKMAGLIKEGGGWKKWPKDMLYARCLSRLARRMFPDIIGMGYVEGEIRENNNKPMVGTEIEINGHSSSETDEELFKTEEEKLRLFLSQFDKEKVIMWKNYIDQLREKLKITVSQIIDKYNQNPDKANENFESWIAKTGITENISKVV